MAPIVIFHSVLGLRAVELDAAERFRAAGHDVWTPDLYEGETADTIPEGFDIKDRIGWDVMTRRAHAAVADLPPEAALVGVSMGAGVVHEVLASRPDTAALLLVHGILGPLPAARPGLPIHLHVADPDPFASPAAIAAWLTTATTADTKVFTYPGLGHFYTDTESPDHDEEASALTWQRGLDFLAAL